MKALSIQQPWVYAILQCGKNVENRSWRTWHRGWLALHASKEWREGSEFPRGVRMPERDAVAYSAICGVARLIGVVTRTRSKWFCQPAPGEVNYGWVLVDVHALKKPVPCKGSRMLWDVPTEVEAEVKRQLPKVHF